MSFAGTDITVGRDGRSVAVIVLTSRDTGVLAAIGVARVDVWRKPIVAILSTGNEIIAPGEPMQPLEGLRLERASTRRRRPGAGRRADSGSGSRPTTSRPCAAT